MSGRPNTIFRTTSTILLHHKAFPFPLRTDCINFSPLPNIAESVQHWKNQKRQNISSCSVIGNLCNRWDRRGAVLCSMRRISSSLINCTGEYPSRRSIHWQVMTRNWGDKSSLWFHTSSQRHWSGTKTTKFRVENAGHWAGVSRCSFFSSLMS